MRPVVRYGVMRPVVNYGYTLRKGGGATWSPAQLDAYLATLDRAFAFDFSKTDRHWQAPNGINLADDIGENIGFASNSASWAGRDFSTQMALQADLMSYASPSVVDFAGSAGSWTAGTKTIANGAIGTNPSYPRVLFAQSQVNVPAGYYRYAITLGTPSPANLGGIQATNGGSAATNTGQSPGTLYFPGDPAQRLSLSFDGTSLWSTTLAVVIKAIPGPPAVQATANFCPKRQVNGAKYDGSDDRSTTTYGLSGSGDLFAFDYADIPASLAATQILFGAQDGSSNGAYVGVTTAGALRVKVGATVVDSTGIDLRGGRHKLGAFTVGSTVYLVADDVIVGSGTWTGSLPTTTWNLGSVNANGTPSAFFGGSLLCPVHGRDTIDLARAKQITSAIAAKG